MIGKTILAAAFAMILVSPYIVADTQCRYIPGYGWYCPGWHD